MTLRNRPYMLLPRVFIWFCCWGERLPCVRPSCFATTAAPSALDAEFFVATQADLVELGKLRLQGGFVLDLGLGLTDGLHEGRGVCLEIRPLRPYLGRCGILTLRRPQP